MPRFSANLTYLFNEKPLLARIAAARAAGFAAIEVQFPYDVPLDDLDRARRTAGVEWVLLNIPGGDFAKGDRGLGALPDRVAEFRAGVEAARRYAERLGVARVNLLAGIPGPQHDRERCRATLVDNLRFAARAFAEIGAIVCVEPINSHDSPGFFVNRSDEAIAILDAADAANTAIQYDIYHAQRMEGDLIATLARLKPRIGYIQFSDVPNRTEPGHGEINFTNVFAAIDRIGYDGWVGAEYRPTTPTTEASLGWFAPWRAAQRVARR